MVGLLYTGPVMQVRLQSSHYYLILELMYMQEMWWVTVVLLLVYSRSVYIEHVNSKCSLFSGLVRLLYTRPVVQVRLQSSHYY